MTEFGELVRVTETFHGASLSAALTLQIFIGADIEDCQAVAAWVACDPHEQPRPSLIDEIAREVLRLRQFENALCEHATWESGGGRW